MKFRFEYKNTDVLLVAFLEVMPQGIKQKIEWKMVFASYPLISSKNLFIYNLSVTIINVQGMYLDTLSARKITCFTDASVMSC